jgi:hypothetical protein
MSFEERRELMTTVVLPDMAKLFQQFEGKPNADMACATCHGGDAEEIRYKMPYALPALNPAHLPDPDVPGFGGAMAKFMFERVTPRMTELLGVPRYDATTGRGFGCFHCHPNAALGR